MIKNTSEKVNYEEKIKEEKGIYEKSIMDMMKTMNEAQKKRIYKLTLYIYNKNK